MVAGRDKRRTVYVVKANASLDSMIDVKYSQMRLIIVMLSISAWGKGPVFTFRSISISSRLTQDHFTSHDRFPQSFFHVGFANRK
jgi:hypothetical protein